MADGDDAPARGRRVVRTLAVGLGATLLGALVGSRMGVGGVLDRRTAVTAFMTTPSATVIGNADEGYRAVVPDDGGGATDPSFTAHNKYIMRDGPIGVDYPWLRGVIVEPHRQTYFEPLDYKSESVFRWSVWVEGRDQAADAEMAEARGYVHEFKNPGNFIVQMTETRDERVYKKARGVVHVKYVRRELRQLFEEDRGRFFEAYRTLWLVTTGEGRRKYGNDAYKGIDYFIRLHLVDAGAFACDGFHDGAGFLNSHVAINLELERAIQVVDPAIALPYWDYTIEAAAVNTTGNLSRWRESSIFSPDFLGTLRPMNHKNIVDDGGYWDHLPMLRDDEKEYTSYTNAYGMMRSAWNTLNTPFLTRTFKSYGYVTDHFPTCGDVHDVMNLDVFYNGTQNCTEGCGSAGLTKEFALQVMYDPHGTVHNMVGGMWAIDAKEYMSEGFWMAPGGKIDTYTLFQELNPKGSWMSELITCPDYCSADTDQLDCMCECSSATEAIRDSKDPHAAYEHLERQGALDWIKHRAWSSRARDLLEVRADKATGPYLADGTRRVHFADGRSYEDADAIFAALSTQICDAGFLGTMMDSGAPLDPVFYLTHSAVERYWQWKRLSPHPYDDMWTDGSSYSECSRPAHNYNDTRLWKNLVDANEHYYTNGELNDIFDPSNDILPYVYAAFQWHHCDALGSPVREFWKDRV